MFNCHPMYGVEQNLLGETVKALLEKPEYKELLESKLKLYLENPEVLNKVFDRMIEQNAYYIRQNELASLLKEAMSNKKEFLLKKAEETLITLLADSKMFYDILRNIFSQELYTLANLAIEKSMKNRKKVAAKKKSAKK